MKCPHCGNEVEVEIFLLKSPEKVPMKPHEYLKPRVEIHENEGGPPPAIPRGMSGENFPPPIGKAIEKVNRKAMSAAERARAYRARRKLQNKLGL